MEKPQIKIKKVFDYHECAEYIEKKYGIDTRDYKNWYINYKKNLKKACEDCGVDYSDLEENLIGANENDPEVKRKLENRKRVKKRREELGPPYQDFWHWLVEKHDISNGGELVLDEGMAAQGSWQKEILDLFMKEFGEKNSRGFLQATFETNW